MDIAEWEFYVSCSRLKSERTKSGLKKKDLEKQLIHSYKRLIQIGKEKGALGYKDLVPPVQKGWKRGSKEKYKTKTISKLLEMESIKIKNRK